MTPLEFGVDNLSETARENFIGEIVRADYPCDCDVCQKGDTALERIPDATVGEDRLHVEWKPLTQYDKNQHQWLIPRRTKKSAWGAWNEALEEAGLLERVKSNDDLMGIVTEVESIQTEVGIGDRTVDVWTIKRVVTPEEVEELGASQEEEEHVV